MNRSSAAGNVAVIGAGLAGVTAAFQLSEAGLSVRVFDKARGPGGRMSTRRNGTREFDHGAQYFTAKENAFRSAVDSWVAKGIVAPWTGEIVKINNGSVEPTRERTERFVAVPRMSSLCRSYSEALDVEYQTVVSKVARSGGTWEVFAQGDSLGEFQHVVITTPPAQAVPLLVDAPQIASEVQSIEMAPCLAVMVSFGAPVTADWSGAFVSDSPLSWIARNSSKPGRPKGESWVLHASPEWSNDNFDKDPEQVAEALVNEFFRATGCSGVDSESTETHRWRYAKTKNPLGSGYLYESEMGIGVCGDWCRGDRVEDAYLSARYLAEHLIAG